MKKRIKKNQNQETKNQPTLLQFGFERNVIKNEKEKKVSKILSFLGKENLKTDVINYRIDLSNVVQVNNDCPGAQLLASKKTLKDKIFERKQDDREEKKVRKLGFHTVRNR